MCVCVRAPLAPRHFCLGCAVWVSALGFGSRLRPAFLAGVLGCVFLFAHSACSLPILAGVRGVWVLVRFLDFAPPILAEVLGCVCLCAGFACSPPFMARVCGLGFGFCLRPATPGWGVGMCVFVCALRLYPANPGRCL